MTLCVLTPSHFWVGVSRTNPWNLWVSAPGEWHCALSMWFSDSPWGEQDDSRARFYCDLVLSGPKSLCTPVIGFPSANVYSDRNVLSSLEGLSSCMVMGALSALVLWAVFTALETLRCWGTLSWKHLGPWFRRFSSHSSFYWGVSVSG